MGREEIARVDDRIGDEEGEVEEDCGDEELREHLLSEAVPVHVQDSHDAGGEEAEDEHDVADVAQDAPGNADGGEVLYVASHRDDGEVHRVV